MPAEPLRLSQPDVLGDDSKVVTRTAVGGPPAIIVAEERTQTGPKKPRSLGTVSNKPLCSARCNRHKAGSTVLSALHSDDAGAEIDVAIVELQRLIDAKAGYGNEPE